MKATHFKPLCSLLALALLGAMAMAQDAPEPVEEPEETPAPKLNKLTLRYAALDISGNRSTARKIGSPANGLAIEELSYLRPGNDLLPFIRLTLRDTPDRDYSFGANLILPGGATQFSVSSNHRRYQKDAVTPTGDSDDYFTTAEISHNHGNTGAFVSYLNSERDIQPERPRPSRYPNTQRIAAGIQTQSGPVNASFTASQTRTTDRSNLIPRSVQQVYGAQLAGDLGPNISLLGVATHTRVSQSALEDSKMNSLSLSGVVDLWNRTSLRLDLSRQDLDLPNVESSFDRQRFSTGAQLNTYVAGWGVQLGYRHRESERVRRDRTAVDVPSWDTYEARLSRRLSDQLRVSVKGSWDDLRDSYVSGTRDTRQLTFDDRIRGQAKIDYTHDTTSLYAIYNYQFRQNRVRDVALSLHNFAFGASQQVSEPLSVYGELSFDSFAGGNRVLATEGQLEEFFPNSMNASAGFSLTMDSVSTLSAAVNGFSTNNVWGAQFSASYTRQFADDRSFELSISPWTTRDRLLHENSFRSTLVTLKYSLKF